MQCKSCQTELPKKAKICPKCGAQVGKPAGNTKILAIIGMVIMLIGGLLPFVQSNEKLVDGVTPKAYAFGFMNISMPVMWYLFIALLVVGILLVVAKKEKFSIIASALSMVVLVVSMFVFQFTSVNGKTKTGALKYEYHNLSDLLSNGYKGNSYSIGCGLIVTAIGLIVAIVGVFWDVVALFKKDLGVDAKYLSNTLNANMWHQMFYFRGFYLMFLPVFVMVLLFFYWPMLGCRYAFTSYVLANPYYMGLFHFETMFRFDTFFWQAFRNTLILSITKLILNTGAAVIISLLLNEISNMLFKKTVQTIIYLPHFMSWVVVAAVFKMLMSVNSSGVINGILMNINLISEPIDFFGSSKYWTGTFFIMNIWKDTGWGTILFLATLSGISPDLYEAAQIDGANRFKRLIYITLPALANTIITVFILNLAKVMNLFESVFVTQSAGTYDVSQVLQTYVYNKTFNASFSDYGYTTAVGLFKSFVGMILVLGCNWMSKKVRGRGIV
ncbi:MAG: ABC transporter permease subunit [Eubacteriales bacterium]|nr:ABC transporter permease subunit [Eubacteriales bacterium]